MKWNEEGRSGKVIVVVLFVCAIGMAVVPLSVVSVVCIGILLGATVLIGVSAPLYNPTLERMRFSDVSHLPQNVCRTGHVPGLVHYSPSNAHGI